MPTKSVKIGDVPFKVVAYTDTDYCELIMGNSVTRGKPLLATKNRQDITNFLVQQLKVYINSR